MPIMMPPVPEPHYQVPEALPEPEQEWKPGPEQEWWPPEPEQHQAAEPDPEGDPIPESQMQQESATAPLATPDPAVDGGGGSVGLGGGGSGVLGEGQGLPALMDELLGDDIGPSLAEIGPASARVAEAVAPQGAGQSFLAGVFWWLFTYSEAYGDVLRRLRASRRARPIVVCHADGTRFDLLLLDPRRGKRLAAVQLKGDETHARFVSSALPRERLNSLLRHSGLGDSLEPETLLNSAQELAASSEFGVAVVNAPREIPTCALSPAVPIQSADNRPVATLGCFLTDVEVAAVDTCLATTANHALENERDTLTIGGAALDVVCRHNPTDSCLVRVNKSVLDGRQQNGLKGPLRITPSLYRPAHFDGAASGPTRTKITSFDTEILDPQLDEICRVYTEADTAKGDSGAALIDENDFIVGFARRLSRYNAPVQYSSWVWAEQVYMAHDLFTHVTLGV